MEGKQSAQHTPGPWQLLEARSTGWPNHVVQGTINGYPAGPALAQVPKHGTQSLANARLIAAAPDLLEAVMGLLEGVPDAWCLPGAGMQPRVMAARSAIDKATRGAA